MGGAGKHIMAKTIQLTKVTWAHMIRDLGLKSMDKGQFPVFLLALYMMTIVIKMTPEQVGTYVDRILDAIINLSIVGWLLVPPLLILWYFHAKHVRRVAFREMERMGKQKSQLQKELLPDGKDVKSSRGQRP